ncbi:MAG: transcription termination factor NusA [Dehalococcoidia bacterium]
MKNEFLLAITQLAAERNLPKDMVLDAVKAALLSIYKNYDLSVEIVPTTGDIRAFAHKTVVKLPEDPGLEISLAEARKLQKGVKEGQTVDIEIDPLAAGRIGVQTAKQVVMQRLREAEHQFIFGTFAHKEGDVLSGVIKRIDSRQILVGLGQAEGVLPISEQVRAEQYRPGQRLQVYLVEVTQTNRGPRLLLSRSHPRLVQRLFELEVPEIKNGIIDIKGVAREAGFRTKLAVTAHQPGIDAVGSCIGLRGIRIQNVTNEIQGERIDIVAWASDQRQYIANSISPAKALEVRMDPAENTAIVIVPDNELSLAIGKEGQNARLAAKLTDWRIDIKSESAAAEEGLLVEEEPIEEIVAEMGEFLEPIEEEEITPELEEEEEEEEEEFVRGAPVIVEEPPASDEAGIRFAEDLLPSQPVEKDPEKGKKKKKKRAAEKGKAKKKAKSMKVFEEDDEEDFDEDFELDLDDEEDDDES